MRVATFKDLAAVRRENGLKRVDIEMDRFLSGNLPLYALKYALWACEKGGEVRVSAPNTIDSMSFVSSRWSFQLLMQLLCKGIDGLAQVVAFDVSKRNMSFVRVSEPLPPAPWSAAVVFSGNSSERPLLDKCLAGLMAQPELTGAGQIVVCGPDEARASFSEQSGVEYLACDTPMQAGRFLVGAKKNFAIQNLRHERVLVCHTRIVLRPGCLAAIPTEFDLLTPRVWIKGASGDLPYLDVGFFHGDSVAMQSSTPQVPIYYRRALWLQYLARRYPYVDGGLFCIRRSLAMSTPLSSTVAWGEAEDAEWSMRLLQNGQLVELAIDANADSVTCKTPRYAKWGNSTVYKAASTLWQPIRAARNRFLPL